MIKYNTSTLKNGLTLITIPLPQLDSVTTLIAVGAGSRYETKNISGLSHFLEHMFFKGSKKYPSAEIISTLVDSIGAINNAFTDKEATVYFIKSSVKHSELSSDILSSMLKDPLLDKEEIDREKGVIVEEMKMYKDDPARYIWSLYLKMQFGEHPLGWDIIGSETTVKSFTKDNFQDYMKSLYVPENMALVYVGNLPKDIEKQAQKYFGGLVSGPNSPFVSFKSQKQVAPKVNIFYKKTDQAKLVLGMESFDRYSKKRYILRVLSGILGSGMSSRLFLQVRERRGLAYYVGSTYEPYKDTGFFAVYGGLRLDKLEEGLKVILAELKKIATEKVSKEELQKAKEMIRGRLAIASESTNFLGETFGVEYILDRRLETFDEYLQKIDAVTIEDIQEVAQELFKKQNYNLQIIAPIKNAGKFEEILNA